MMPSQTTYPSSNGTVVPEQHSSADGLYSQPHMALNSGLNTTASSTHSAPPESQYAPNSSFDTNYIEDYLKLIESMAGENPQMAIQASHRFPHLAAASAATFPPISGHSLPPTFANKPEANFCPPAVHPGALMSEDVRKTILSVLNQEGEKAANNDNSPGEHTENQTSNDASDSRTSSQTLPSIDQIVRNVKPENSESGDKSGMDPVSAGGEDPLSDDRVEFTASEDENEENEVVKRLIMEDTDSEGEHKDKKKEADKTKKGEDEQQNEKAQNGEENHEVVIKQEVMDESEREEVAPPINKSKSKESKSRKEKRDTYVITNKVKDEADDSPNQEDRPVLKVSIRRQKRKKKVPVKLYKEDMMETDEEELDNEEEDITYSIKQAKPPKVKGKRGRPRKEKSLEKSKRKKEEEELFPPKISKRGRKRKLKRKLQCPKCVRVFSKPEALIKHTILHDREMLFSCHVCGMKYARPGELTRHLRKHAGETYNCTECGEEFQDSKDFKKHRTELHDDPKPFLCTFMGCSFRSDKPSNLEKHAAIHSGIRMYNCARCGRDFAQSNGLRSHLRSCLQERKYLCDICGQKFNHLQSLKSHRMLHTGEKPHQCRDCGARFTDHRNFKRHRRIHENLFPYPCTYCEKRFRHSNSLKAHIRTHTMEPPPTKGEARKKVIPALEAEVRAAMEKIQKKPPRIAPPPPSASIADILSPANIGSMESLPPMPESFRLPASTRENVSTESMSMPHSSALRLPPHSSLLPAMSQALTGRMEMHLTPNESYLSQSREDMRLTSPHPSTMPNVHPSEDHHMGLTSPRPHQMHDNLHTAHSQEDLRLMSPRPPREDYHVPTHEDMRLTSPHPSQMREDMRLTSPHPSHMQEDPRLMSPHPSHMRDDLRMTSPHPSHMREDLRLTSPHPAHMREDLRLNSSHPLQMRDDLRHSSQMREDLRLMTSHSLPSRDSLPFPLSHSLPTREDFHLPPAHSFSLMYRDGASALQSHDPLHLSARETHGNMVFPPRDDMRMFQRDYKYS